LPGSTTKKVLVQRLDRQLIAGYANPQSYLRTEGVEILNREGQLLLTPYKELKAVYFVREFETAPDAAAKKAFQSRPKLAGLWVRMRFSDNELLEGIIPNELLQLMDHGLTITPPDPYSNNQKIFIPRLALRELTVLGVIGSPVHKPRAKPQPLAEGQIELFEK